MHCMPCVGRWLRVFPVSLAILATMPGGRLVSAEPTFTHSKALEFCAQLKVGEETGWEDVLARIDALKSEIEKRAERMPYEKPDQVAKPLTFLKRKVAKSIQYSTWRDGRFVSNVPPSGGSATYINQAAGVLRGDLTDRSSDEVVPPTSSKYAPPKPAGSPKPSTPIKSGITSKSATAPKPSKPWDGNISDSVVIIDGVADIDGYISASVVIAAGPIVVHGYISDSLVISLAKGSVSAIDVKHGYVSGSIVVGDSLNVGSFRESVAFGRFKSDDLRGGDLREIRLVLDVLTKFGTAPLPVKKAEPQLAQADPKPAAAGAKPAAADAKPAADGAQSAMAEQMLGELLTAERLTRVKELADAVGEYRLTAEQVQRLIDAADQARSEALKNLLWHAIRQTQSLLGRQYLIETVAEKSAEARQIAFLESLRNPATYDVPLLIKIYENSTRPSAGSPKVAKQILALVARDWDDLVADWKDPQGPNVPPKGDTMTPAQREVYERRHDEAGKARYELIEWLVANGRQDQHRIDAFEASLHRLGTNYRPDTITKDHRVRLAKALLDSSAAAEFRARVVPLVAKYVELEDFLADDEPEGVRLAAVKAVHALAREVQKGVAYKRELENAIKTLERLLDREDAPAVRDAATRSLKELQRDLEQYERRKKD